MDKREKEGEWISTKQPYWKIANYPAYKRKAKHKKQKRNSETNSPDISIYLAIYSTVFWYIRYI